MSYQNLPAWFLPVEHTSYAGPVHLWLLLALSASSRTHTIEIANVLDQIEPAIHGAWSAPDDDLESRARIALAHSVAKAVGSPVLDVIRDILESAGVVDWPEFFTDVVRGSARFHWRMATFQSRDRYRWVATRDIPVVEKPHRLPQQLATDWDDLATRRRGWLRRRPDATNVKDQWVSLQRERVDVLGEWRMAQTDWAVAVEKVREFWDKHDAAMWDERNARVLLGDTQDPSTIGALSLLVDPIVWTPGWLYLGNGRHRALALAVQDVPKVLVCDR